MKKQKIKQFLKVIIIIALLASFVLAWQRYTIESKNKIYDIVMDYEDLAVLAKNNAMSIDETLEQFKKQGLSAVAVYESSIEKLKAAGLVSVHTYADMLAFSENGFINNDSKLAEQGANAVYITITDNDLAKDLIADFYRRFGQSRVTLFPYGNMPTIAVKTDLDDDFFKQPLGLMAKEMKKIEEHGLGLILRPTNYEKVKKEDIEALFKRIDSVVSSETVHGVMFAGKEMLGFENLMDYVALEMQKRNWSLFMTESPVQLQFVKQAGQYKMAELMNYKLVRAYAIPKEEQPKLDYKTIVHRFVLGAQERNLNLGLLRKIKDPLPQKTIFETNLQYVKEVKEELTAENFIIGKPIAFNNYVPSLVLQSIVCAGILAGVLLLISKFFEISKWQLGCVFICWLFCFLLLLKNVLMMKQILAFLAAIVFPVLAFSWQIDKLEVLRKNFQGKNLLYVYFQGVWRITVMLLLSLTGAFFLSGILSDARFWLEIDYYRGVKLTFIMPLLLTAILFLSRFNILNETVRLSGQGFAFLKNQLLKLWNYPVKIGLLAMFGFFAVVLLIFIGRSGHTDGVPVPAIEIKMRYFLENVMYARPREKEFLIGYPAFFILLWTLARKLPNWVVFVFSMASVIALASLVQTFAHMRTPFEMSFMRAWSGWFLGILVGALALIFVEITFKIWHYLQRRFAKDG